MKKAQMLLTIVLITVGLGCQEKAVSNVVSSNPNIVTQKLFTTENCTVYRFFDSGAHYFAVCDHCTPTTVSSEEKRGKSSVEVEVPTSCTCKEKR